MRCSHWIVVPFFFFFSFFPSSKGPVPSGTLPAFYRPPRLLLNTPLGSASGRTDSRCLPRQRDRNLFIALADRHSRSLIGGGSSAGSPLEKSIPPWTKESKERSRAKAPGVIILICGRRMAVRSAKNLGRFWLHRRSVITANAVGTFWRGRLFYLPSVPVASLVAEPVRTSATATFLLDHRWA